MSRGWEGQRRGSHTTASPHVADPQLHPLSSSTQPTCVASGLLSTTGKPLWLEEVSLRMSTTVPTRSILRRQVTGVLMTSLQGRLGVKHSPTAARPKYPPQYTRLRSSDASSVPKTCQRRGQGMHCRPHSLLGKKLGWWHQGTAGSWDRSVSPPPFPAQANSMVQKLPPWD